MYLASNISVFLAFKKKKRVQTLNNQKTMMKKNLCMMLLAGFLIGCSNDDGGGLRPKERKKIELSRSEQVMTEETTDFLSGSSSK